MPINDLENYIKNQLNLGQNKKQIHKNLLKQGYTTTQIKDIFKKIDLNEENLDKFIQRSLNKGFTIPQITEHLRKSKVPEIQIHNAIALTIQNISQKEKIETIVENKYVKYGTPAILTIIFIILLYGIFSNLGEQKLLDVDISILNEYARAGEDLNININARNFGKSRDFDITTKLELLGTDISYEDTFTIETIISKKITLSLPKDLTNGEYVLKATLIYGEKTEATSSIRFYINKVKTIEQEPEVPVIEERVIENQINQTNPVIINNTNEPQNNNNNNNINDTIVKTNTSNINNNQPIITENAKTDNDWYDDALNSNNEDNCAYINDNEQKSYCYIDISKNKKDKEVCIKINDNYFQEACLVQIASMGDLSACDTITITSFKRMCEDYKLNS